MEDVQASMHTDMAYESMADEDRLELAKYGYELEINRINYNYYGKEGDIWRS